ncbi:hypothetical protein D9619_013222 [Psilocybe cf. subviscida]|uniref:NAD-dependent protein deacetylase n=1 Tax=Psilocybe cf. subviscida TaxID=2480587 RepID=A0A8H5B780_9AGAR|nr:hypothetical protein D9619_013222 [Psilocybe cf. subviscida]
MAPRSSNRTQSRKPQVLDALDIPSLAKYIKSERCENVMLMLGAGISTSAGIPDFRSPKTEYGNKRTHLMALTIKSNLARLNLPHPEAVFEIGFFQKNPVPFYTLAHELYPGKFRPTVTHSFIRLLHEKKRLHTCFTQNIDTLERRAGVPDEKIIEAHGSFATQRCIKCKREFDDNKMREHVLAKKIAKCESCGGYVKPDIVFFGEALPKKFINSVSSMESADLLIVMGTSLTVHPFASLAWMVPDSCPRVLVNLERVGDFGSRADDLVLLGQCDDYVRKLCKELGWLEDLERLWEETKESVIFDSLEDVKKEDPKPKEKVKDTATVKTEETLEEISKGLSDLAIDPDKESKTESDTEKKPAADSALTSNPPVPSQQTPKATSVDEAKTSTKEQSGKDSYTPSSTLKNEPAREKKL